MKRSILLGALLLSLAAAFQSVASTGLVVWWKLDETGGTLADDSAAANDGTHANGPTPSPDLAPLTFTNLQSLSFDGVDDQLTRATVTGIAAGNTPHTMATWIKVTALPANRAWIALLGNEGAGAHHWLIDSAGVTAFGVWNGTQKVPALVVGAWAHVAMTFDGTNLQGYFNGTPIGTPAAATFNLQGVPLSLAQVHNSENYFNGLFDDFRLYDRALTATEVQYLAAGNGPPPAPLNLSATASDGSVALAWSPVAGATSYTVLMGTAPGGPYPTTLASGITTTSLTHSPAVNGTPYYYVVIAVHSAGGSSANSLEASATPQPPPPRINDHEEGFLDGRCACGASGPLSPAWAAFGALLLGLLALGRRPLQRRSTN